MTTPEQYSELERRVAQLEDLVAKLQVKPVTKVPKPPPVARPAAVPAFIKPKPTALTELAATKPTTSLGERWLARVGVLFFVLALSFLFKYAIDHSWITPTFRLIIGGVVASAMMGVGLKLHATRRRYSQILLGGSIAIFYLCGYASHQLYGLVEHTPAFFYMVVVTVVALLLAVKQDHPSLACIGTAGGLMTPFLLPTPWGTIPALVVYSSTILLGGGVILMRRGWRSLVTTLWLGGWPVIWYCIDEIETIDRDFLWLGIPTWWWIGGLLPFLYNWKTTRFPAPTAQAKFPPLLLRVGAVVSSLGAFVLISWNWHLTERKELWPLALVFAVGYLTLAFWAKARAQSLKVAVEIAVMFAALTLGIAFEDDWAFLSLLALALGVFELAQRPSFASSRFLSYALMVILGLWFAGDTIAYLGTRGGAKVDLTLMLKFFYLPALLWSARYAPTKEGKFGFQIAAYVGMLAWTFHGLRYLENGLAYTSAAWAAQGGLALLFGLNKRIQGLQHIALATLALVSGKMLLFDMANMDMIWRILLFFGVGAAFLGLSYLMNRPRKAA